MHIGRLYRALTKHIALPFQNRAEGHVRQLSLGDKFIFGITIGCTALAAIGVIGAVRAEVIDTTPAQGGSLTEGVIGAARFVNPVLAISDTDRDLVELIYAGLMTVDAQGTVVPELAATYDISPDGRVYTFTLRNDAVFHDGRAITARDVIFTIEMIQDPAIKSPRLANWDGIQAQALDAQTVQFTLPEPYAPFLENTTIGILPEHIWSQVPAEEFPFSQFVVEPIGSGPYEVERIRRDSAGILKEYELRAFEDYVLGTPYINTVRLVFFGSETDLVRALQRNDIDSTHSLIPDVTTTHQIVTAPYTRVFGIFFNQNENPVLSEREVRVALDTVLDRERIIEEVLGGYGQPLTSPLPFHAQTQEYTAPEDRISEGVAILDTNGWDYDTEIRRWSDGDDTSISLTLRTSNIPELQAIAAIAKENFESIGIPTNVELFAASDLQQNVIRSREYQSLLFGMVLGRIPDAYAFWHSSQRNDPGLNVAMYANITADTALERAREATDFAEREEHLDTFLGEVAQDVPAVFTHTPELTYLLPRDMKGVALPALTTSSDRFSTIHTWYRETEEVWPFLHSK